MNENIDLTKILKDCPKGWKFWSPIFGEVEFERNYGNNRTINISVIKDGTEWYFTSDAKIILGGIKSQEVMIYPSRYFHDWSRFNVPWYKKEKFDTKTLKPFDRVLTIMANEEWSTHLFSHIKKIQSSTPYVCNGIGYKCCIPYNDDTKHLVGTKDDAPEYYKYWED